MYYHPGEVYVLNQSPRQHAARRYTTAAPRRSAEFQSAAWKLIEVCSSQDDPRDEGGCRTPGPHTAPHTRRRLPQSIHMVPKTEATGARQHHPPASATGREFTSLPVDHPGAVRSDQLFDFENFPPLGLFRNNSRYADYSRRGLRALRFGLPRRAPR